MKSKFLLFTAALFVLFAHSNAQTPEWVMDNARDIFVVGDKLFMEKYNSITKTQEIWVSDGTATGTTLLKGLDTPGANIYTELNGKIYFIAVDKDYLAELWATDGTTAGTYLVKELKPSDYSAYILTVFNNKLYLLVKDDEHGAELWVSDGTEKGTKLFKDLNPGKGNGLTNHPEAIVYKDKMYFSALMELGKNNYDVELWVSDGTEEGTKLFKDLNPDGLSYPYNYTIVNDKLYFNATTKAEGTELWVSDGTVDGTFLLKNIAGNYSGAPRRPLALNGKAYFITSSKPYELYVTDGTREGTFLLEDSVGYHSAIINGELFFSKLISDEDSLQYALYKTNGKPGGASLVKVIEGGTSSGYAVHFREANNRWYFAIYDNKEDYEFSNIWETDGTAENTKLVRDNQGKLLEEYREYDLISFNNSLFFVMNNPGIGYSLYRLDSPSTSATEFAQNNVEVVLFPNPASNQLTIKTDSKLIGSNYTILNIMGQTVRSGKIISDNTLLDVGDLPGGTYFVQIQSKDGNSISRFVKE